MGNITKYISKEDIVIMVLALLGCWFLVTYIYPFTRLKNLPNADERNQIKQQLPSFREKWLSQKISNYDIDLQIEDSSISCDKIPNVSLYADLTLMVRNGVFSKTQKRREEFKTFPIQTLFCQYYYSPYTIIEMFNIVKGTLSSKVWPEATLNVSFDHQYGFVSYYEYICPQCGDLRIAITYSNFRPVELDQ